MDTQPQDTPTVQADPNPLKSIAFISLNEIVKDVFRGGVLVADAFGKPLEFRCTSAIQPTAVQKTLYGSTLCAHMSVELTARPLLAALKEKPDVVLVIQADFIELRSLIDIPLFIVSKQGSTLATQQDADKLTKSELLTSTAGKFEPVTVTCHWQHADDLKLTMPDLDKLFARFDLVEPFARIDNALKLLHEKNVVPNR
jgi:hypothetical protein